MLFLCLSWNKVLMIITVSFKSSLWHDLVFRQRNSLCSNRFPFIHIIRTITRVSIKFALSNFKLSNRLKLWVLISFRSKIIISITRMAIKPSLANLKFAIRSKLRISVTFRSNKIIMIGGISLKSSLWHDLVLW